MKRADKKEIGGKHIGKRTAVSKISDMVGNGKLRIRSDGKAYSSKGYYNAADSLNSRISDVRGGLDTIRDVSISKQFMKNFDHNVRLLEESKSQSILSYNNRNAIKPMDVIDETLRYEKECEQKNEPVTMAGLCHKMRCSRLRLMEMLKQKGYDGARICVHNVLMKYAENYLFTGKNVQGSVFYLKNAFPEFYQDKMTTETNVKISLVDLSKKADSMEYKLKKANAIKGEVASKLETKIENEWIALERKMKDAEPKFEEIEEDVSN